MLSVPVVDDGLMSGSGPRAGGPSRRRTFAPAEKLQHLAAYDQACQASQGGAYLRREGLYSSQVTEWRKLRDAGVLEGRPASSKVGRLTVEQLEIARLRAQLGKAERRLARTEVALDIMGKAHALLEEISESAQEDPQPKLSRATGFCPEAVVSSARWRSREVPGDGHGICPVLTITGWGAQLKGLTPWPARAWACRTLSPLVWQRWAWCRSRSTVAVARVLGMSSSNAAGCRLEEIATERFS
jgi:transposase